MEFAHVEDAIASLEKANADLEPELLDAHGAQELLAHYARAEKLAAFGRTVLARKVADAPKVAHLIGTSMGKAKQTLDTGEALGDADDVCDAFASGDISFEQAGELARAEQACPGASAELLSVAKTESFHVLKERARKIRLEAEQGRGLAARQHDARCARHYNDELGMVHVHLAWEPHVGTPILARAEAEATRLAKKARKEGCQEPFERHLADAYAALLAGSGRGRARRPELVVLVSHEVARRGWTDVRDSEVCKIPGVGPVGPEVAKKIAEDAFLNGVFYDGKDLRHFARWSKHIPVEVAVALELGDPPDFDGVRCVDCGNRFRTEFDHLEPRAARGPTSRRNLKPRCWPCHQVKTQEDRKAGKLTPPEP